jgi:hypothetical protein
MALYVQASSSNIGAANSVNIGLYVDKKGAVGIGGPLFLPGSITSRTSQIEFKNSNISTDNLMGFPLATQTLFVRPAGNAKLKIWSDRNLDVMTFDADNGNVGIGTTNPGYALAISGGNGTVEKIALINTTPSTGRIWSFNSNADGRLYIGDETGAANRIIIDSVGNVGIGTTNPGAKLELSGLLNGQIMKINNGSSFNSWQNGNAIFMNGGSYFNSGGIWYANANTMASIGLNGENKGDIVFVSNTGLVPGNIFTPAEAMRISSFNVGIGTSTPISRLSFGTALAGTALKNSIHVWQNGNYEWGMAVPANEWRNWMADDSVLNHFSWGKMTVDGTRGYTELMRLSREGNVGIGIGAVNPIARLDILSGAARTGTHPAAVKGLYITGDFGGASDGVEIRHSNGTQGIGIGYNSLYAAGSSADQNLNIMPKGTGGVGINIATPSRKFFVNGDAGGTGVWNNDSDVRLKKNIETISGALAKVSKLRGVNFEWIDTTNHAVGKQMGLIAQEALGVIPEVVSKPGEYYSMAYSPIVALLIEGMKEQQKQIEELKAANAAQQQDIELLKRK